MVRGSERMKSPAFSGIMAMGMKASRVVRVAVTTGQAMEETPSAEAFSAS